MGRIRPTSRSLIHHASTFIASAIRPRVSLAANRQRQPSCGTFHFPCPCEVPKECSSQSRTSPCASFFWTFNPIGIMRFVDFDWTNRGARRKSPRTRTLFQKQGTKKCTTEDTRYEHMSVVMNACLLSGPLYRNLESRNQLQSSATKDKWYKEDIIDREKVLKY